ncbi:MAG TPA: YceI family protein [Thermoanaerobaculia bacterium]|nr:YceI family protein [Thermoanaerobaculia bacterium]
MKSLLSTAVALLLAASAFAADTFVVDRNHSEATFQIRHMVSHVSGRFDDFKGSIMLDRANPAGSSVEFTINASSINTGVANRDNDLRSANFFEVAKYPEITFKSTSVKPGARKDSYDVTGQFTMHGVTKTITLPVEFGGFIKDPWGNERAGFSINTQLNRQDYGITWNKTLDNGGLMLSDDVTVGINIEAVRKLPAPAASK